jgi:hypothetical protein
MMTDDSTTILIDGEPDLASEIARLDKDLEGLAELMPSNEEIEATFAEITPSDADLAAFAAPSDADLAELASSLKAMLSDKDRASAPKDKSPFDQIQWMVLALSKDQQHAKPVVPVTDTSKPALTPSTPDFSTMAAHARMARGYTDR